MKANAPGTGAESKAKPQTKAMHTQTIAGFLAALLPSLFAFEIQAAPDTSSSNLVQNPGFENGIAEGDPVSWRHEAESEAQGTVGAVEGMPHSGRFSVLVDHTNSKGYLHPSQNLTVPSGSYAYRLWARSDADTSFLMQIYDTRTFGGRPRPDDLQVNGLTTREFKLRKDTWQLCEFFIDVTTTFPCSLQIGLRSQGKLWLDDIELVPTPPRLVLAATPKPHPTEFSPEELQRREGWILIHDRTTAIPSDAWLGNSFVGIAFRKGSPSAEYFAAMPGGAWKKLSDLTPIGPGGDRAKAIQSFKVHENYPDKIALDVTSGTHGGKSLTVRFKLDRDRRFVETEARGGVERLAATTNTRYAIVPDWFGGDIVVDAAKTSASRLQLPREKMLLHPVENGDALLQFVWLSPDQAATVTLTGDGPNRKVASAEIDYRRDQRASVWIAALAAPAIWQQKPVADLKDIKGNKLDRPLPFDAVWRVDFRREQDGLIDSWIPTFQNNDGNWDHCRENGSRTMWTSCRGDVVFPAFVQSGSLFLVNTKFPTALQQTYFPGADDLNFDPADVALAYPFERSDDNSQEVPVPREILRQALEGTPDSQYHLKLAPIDMERHRYPATCAVTGEYEKMFDQGEELKNRRKLIEDLRRMDYFVLTKRERIEEYMTWKRNQHDWLLAQKAAKPEVSELAGRFDVFLTRMDDTYSKGRGERMKTPADCQALVDRIEALIDEPAPAPPAPASAPSGGEQTNAKLALAKDIGKQTRSIGGAQDSVLGCLRQIVKELRQTAGIAMLTAKTDAELGFANQLRQATLPLLKETCSHEWR